MRRARIDRKRGLGLISFLATIALVPAHFLWPALLVGQGLLPAPAGLGLILEETDGDFLVNRARVWWIRTEGAASYRLRLTRQDDPTETPFIDLKVPQPSAGSNAIAWVESRPSLSLPNVYGPSTIFDSERIVATVEARDTADLLGAPSSASTILGERPTPRGDVTGDGRVDLADAVSLLFYLFQGGYEPSPYSREYSSDADGNGRLEMADALRILDWLFAQGPAPPETDPHPIVNRLLAGNFHGDAAVNPMFASMGHVQAFETWQGKKHAVVNVYTPWKSTEADTFFNLQLKNIWNNGNVPMITWEPHTGAADESSVEVQGAAGEFDAYWRSWGLRLKDWLKGPDRKFGDEGGGATLDPAAARDNRRAYLRVGHEMNGWWTPWNATTGGNRPEDFQAMWIRLHDLFVNELKLDSQHLQWVWCVNNVDSDTSAGAVIYPCERYYPGNSYVDWLMIDGYNFGFSQSWSASWSSATTVFASMIGRLRKLAPGKPIGIAEYGSTSIDAKNPFHWNLEKKSYWLIDTLGYFLKNKVKMALYFNIDKETDWAGFGGKERRGDETFRTYQAYSAYRRAMHSAQFIAPDAANPRLLTDQQFQGN